MLNQSGNWGNVANWRENTTAHGLGHTADFAIPISDGQFVNLSGNRTIGYINLVNQTDENGAFVIKGEDTLTLSATNLGTEFLDAPAFLPDSNDFFSRAGVTDERAKYDIDQFVRGCKQLGIWDKLVYVPCLSQYGGVHQLGGAVQRTDTPWTLMNATVTPLGVDMTRNNDLNYMETDVTVDPSPTVPVTAGSISYQNEMPQTVIQGYSTATVKTSNNRQVYTGQAYHGDPPFWHTYFARDILLDPASITNFTLVTSNYRNSHLAAVCLNDTATYSALTDNKLQSYASTPITQDSTKLRFYPPCNDTKNGVVQGAFLYYDNLTALGEGVWEKFRTLINQTILSRLTSFGNRRILICGQSNSSGNLAIAFSKNAIAEAMGPTELFLTGTGGVFITHWIGNYGSNARTAAYDSQIWNVTTPAPMQRMELPTIGRKQKYFVWIQGESDTQTADAAKNYRSQLRTLLEYVRKDIGNDTKIIVVQIDYDFILRDENSGGFHSNLSVSNFSGALAGLNGAYVITPLVSNSSPYVWNKGAYRVQENNGFWEFIETTNNLILARSSTPNMPHPAMCEVWLDVNNQSVNPDFGTGNRTEWIERVRYAQREIINDLPNVSTFDSRGYSRTDAVHIDSVGLIDFSTNLGNHILGLKSNTPTVCVSEKNRKLIIESKIAGNEGLAKIGLGTLELSGTNAHTGDTLVNQGTLSLNGGSLTSPVKVQQSAALEFHLNSPVSSTQQFTLGSSSVKLNTAPEEPFYELISASSGISGTPTLNPLINGYLLKIRENQLVLLKENGYPAWAAIHAVNSDPDNDKDGDGVSNAVEFILGGTKDTNDITKLPVFTTSANDAIFTFQRKIDSIGDMTYVSIEVSDDLQNFDTVLAVPDQATSNPNGVTVVRNHTTGFDTVTLRFPRGLHQKKFARLKVVVLPKENSYPAWAAIHAVDSDPDNDKDGDGVSNAVEFILGGTKDTNDISKLPVFTTSANDVIFTFQRKIASIGDRAYVSIEVSDDLQNFDTVLAVPDQATSNPNGVTVVRNHTTGFDTVTLRFPRGLYQKKFARLKVVVLPKENGYPAWAAIHAVNSDPDNDKDGDGVSNAVEFILGGTKDTNDISKLPVFTTSANDAIFTFQRKIDSIGDMTYVSIEVSDDLQNFDTAFPVPDRATTNPNGVTVVRNYATGFDTVTLRFPRDLHQKKFARLKVVVSR